MATAAQQAAFKATYGPQAQAAGAALGVDPNLVYAQWANESGYGTNSQAAGYNVAGIQPGGVASVYGSPADFESSYVSLMQQSFPGATNVGSDPAKFVAGLQSGSSGSYFGTDSAATYQANLASIAGANPLGSASTVSGTSGSSPAINVATGAGTGSTAGPTGSAASSMVGTLLNPVWEVISRGLLLFMGFVLVIIALAALLWQSKTVKTTAAALMV